MQPIQHLAAGFNLLLHWLDLWNDACLRKFWLFVVYVIRDDITSDLQLVGITVRLHGLEHWLHHGIELSLVLDFERVTIFVIRQGKF